MSIDCIAEVARQNDWDGIIACHQSYVTCTTWNYQKSSMGIHKLKPKDISKNKSLGIYATVSFFLKLLEALLKIHVKLKFIQVQLFSFLCI